MGTEHLCVLILVRIKGEVGKLNMFKPFSNCFTDRSKAVLLLWIIFVIYVSCLSFLCCFFCSLRPCDHLLVKSLLLKALLCVMVASILSYFLMVPQQRVVLDCINS